MKDGFAKTPHGRIHYLTEGEGPALILVHSNGQSAHSFVELSALLRSRFRVIAMDLPGQGDSDPLSRHYSMEDYADSVAGLMDALGIATAHVSGSSIGGFVTLCFGARHPQRAERLYLIESLLRDQEGWAKAFPGVEKMFGILPNTKEQVAARLHIEVTPEILDRWNIDRYKAGSWSMVHVMWAIREYAWQPDFARLKVPAIALVGAKGNVQNTFEANKDKVPAGLPIRKIANSGHFPMMDNPADLAAAILEFADAKSGAKAA